VQRPDHLHKTHYQKRRKGDFLLDNFFLQPIKADNVVVNFYYTLSAFLFIRNIYLLL